MTNSVNRLVGLGSASLGPKVNLKLVPRLIAPLIEQKNGLIAFEPALHVRRWGAGVGSADWWNAASWRRAYTHLPNEMVFFAEDVFGFQFAVNASGFHAFDPETAALEFMGSTVEEWSNVILEEFEMRTGFPLAHQWQLENGPLKIGYRLAPALPFILGGKYEVSSLLAKSDLELADFRARVYSQIRDLPDGTQVKLRLDDL